MSETRECIDCHETFFIADGEAEFYHLGKGWPLPIRCPEDRAAKKREREERAERRAL